MKKFTIQASINELEKKVAAGGSGASAADDVSFDNTGTGLSSDNVQDAIIEVKNQSDLYPGDSNEHNLSGDIYVRKFSGESIASDPITLIEALNGVVLNAYGYVSESTGASEKRLPFLLYGSATTYSELYQDIETGNVYFGTPNTVRGAYEIYLIYRKNTVTTNRRKK